MHVQLFIHSMFFTSRPLFRLLQVLERRFAIPCNVLLHIVVYLTCFFFVILSRSIPLTHKNVQASLMQPRGETHSICVQKKGKNEEKGSSACMQR